MEGVIIRFKFVFALLIFLLTVSCASAEDCNNLNFTQLNHEIGAAVDCVNLTCDYSYCIDDDNVSISNTIRINGNGHNINANNSSSTFKLANASGIVFDNISFNDIGMFDIDVNSTFNVTFINCIFLDNVSSDSFIELANNSDRMYASVEISSNITDLAFEIVGESTDIEAAQKLASWVGKNIGYESRAGFYQTPDETLNRRMGNCCSQTDLFFRLCIAVGLNNTHKLSFVHVGTIEFGKRHFFALFDDTFVDVSARPKSPWGHASIKNRNITTVTEFPLLPILRAY